MQTYYKAVVSPVEVPGWGKAFEVTLKTASEDGYTTVGKVAHFSDEAQANKVAELFRQHGNEILIILDGFERA